MGYAIAQGQSAQVLVFTLIAAADHITPLTGAAPAVSLSKNGGAYVAAAGAVSEVGNGLYKVAANAQDSNTLGPLALHATATGADPCDDVFSVVAYDPLDASALGLMRLDAAVSAARLDLGQPVPTSNVAQTVGDALNAARAQGFGKWAVAGTSLVLYAPDGSTVVRAFTLDNATNPTTRT